MRSTRVAISSRIERAALAACAAALAACSLLVDTDGLSGGSRDAGTEGGNTADVAAPNVDAAGATDAGGDARWCVAHKPDGGFCDDFDDPGRTSPKPPWDTINADPSGTLTVVPPGVLQLDWPANIPPPNNDCSYVRLLKDMPPATKWTFGFDVFLGDGMGGGYFDDAITNVIWHPPNDAYCQVYLVQKDPGLDDDGNHRPTQKLSLGAWHRVEITVDGDTGQLAMTIDGVNGFSAPQTIPDKCKGKADVSINPGLFCARKNPGATRVLYDNITFVGE